MTSKSSSRLTKYKDRLKYAKTIVKDEPEEALRICSEIVTEDMDGEAGQMALFMSAYIMQEAERWGLAYQMYQRCAQLNPNQSEIYSNMGMCLEEFDPKQAQAMFKRASKLNPKNANAYANEGLLCLQTANPRRCIYLSEKALEIDPELRAAKHNMGLAQLMLRDFENGWKNFYDTLGIKHRVRRDYGVPEWEGQPGKVIVYGEQGCGDEIMYASCLPDLMATNSVVLDTDSRLEDLFRRSFDIPTYGTRFKTESTLLDEHTADYQLAMGQLPYFFRKTEESFPGTPYLKPDPERVIMWKALFDTFKGLKVGIAWRGGLNNTGKKKRSMELDDLAPIFNDKDTYISLEYKEVSKDELDKYGIKSYPQTTGKGMPFDDLAAMVSQLDVVVTACTTVVYIAGALGIPCVVLVPKEPGYRYHMEGEFPWYNSVKLIRQKGPWIETARRVDYVEHIHRVRSSGDGSLSCAVS